MVRPHPDDIKKELEEQEDAYYGDETVSGSNPNPAKVTQNDTEDNIEDVTGNEPKAGVPFSLADEVDDDEMARRGRKNKDYYEEDEPESEMEKIEKVDGHQADLPGTSSQPSDDQQMISQEEEE
jgi:hypothetical protein